MDPARQLPRPPLRDRDAGHTSATWPPLTDVVAQIYKDFQTGNVPAILAARSWGSSSPRPGASSSSATSRSSRSSSRTATIRSTGKNIKDHEAHVFKFDAARKAVAYRHILDTHQRRWASRPD